jgi:hypothetical protein
LALGGEPLPGKYDNDEKPKERCRNDQRQIFSSCQKYALVMKKAMS